MAGESTTCLELGRLPASDWCSAHGPCRSKGGIQERIEIPLAKVKAILGVGSLPGLVSRGCRRAAVVRSGAAAPDCSSRSRPGREAAPQIAISSFRRTAGPWLQGGSVRHAIAACLSNHVPGTPRAQRPREQIACIARQPCLGGSRAVLARFHVPSATTSCRGRGRDSGGRGDRDVPGGPAGRRRRSGRS